MPSSHPPLVVDESAPITRCRIVGCTEPSFARGLCRKAYRLAADRKVLDQVGLAPLSPAEAGARRGRAAKAGPGEVAPVAPLAGGPDAADHAPALPAPVRAEVRVTREPPAPLLAAEINALPERVRNYIHDLETRADPAGDVKTIASPTEQRDGLVLQRADHVARIASLEEEVGRLRAERRTLLRAFTENELRRRVALLDEAAAAREAAERLRVEAEAKAAEALRVSAVAEEG